MVYLIDGFALISHDFSAEIMPYGKPVNSQTVTWLSVNVGLLIIAHDWDENGENLWNGEPVRTEINRVLEQWLWK